MSEVDFEELEYARNRVPFRLYISKRFNFSGKDTAYRNAWKKFEDAPLKELVKDGDEFVLHETDTGIQQIKARFIEDGRGISHLHIQRWSTKTGNPIGEQVVLFGDQISKLLEFVDKIRRVEIPGEAKFNVNEDDLRLVHMPDADARRVLEENPDLVAEFARSKVTTQDVVALAYRRQQLNVFRKMLAQPELAENDWQVFFERNQWIFGYGLSYVFTTGLDGENLQATMRGASLIKTGKRPDAVLKTRAAVSALCLVEIKKHTEQLLKKGTYRSGTWAPTGELSGAVAQTQVNVRVALDEFGVHHRFTDDDGNPTGEELTAVRPRSFLLIGNLSEFDTDVGVNESRYRSFEDYRRNLIQPEILTFDELYERAKFIVDAAEGNEQHAETR